MLSYDIEIILVCAYGMVMVSYLELFGKDNQKVKEVLGYLGLETTEDMGQLMKDVLDISETFTAEDIAYYAKRSMENPKKLATFPEYGLEEKDILEVYRKSLL